MSLYYLLCRYYFYHLRTCKSSFFFQCKASNHAIWHLQKYPMYELRCGYFVRRQMNRLSCFDYIPSNKLYIGYVINNVLSSSFILSNNFRAFLLFSNKIFVAHTTFTSSDCSSMLSNSISSSSDNGLFLRKSCSLFILQYSFWGLTSKSLSEISLAML